MSEEKPSLEQRVAFLEKAFIESVKGFTVLQKLAFTQSRRIVELQIGEQKYALWAFDLMAVLRERNQEVAIELPGQEARELVGEMHVSRTNAEFGRELAEKRVAKLEALLKTLPPDEP